MSQYFQVGDRVLWNPSNGVADLFVRMTATFAASLDVPTGLEPMRADEYQVDPAQFGAFVDALVTRYVSSGHPIVRSLMAGCIATALVLADRAAASVPALSSPEHRDVSGAAAGDAGRLRELADEHARAMPY